MFLSSLLYEGEYLGVPFDAEESLYWARKAADRGHGDGYAMLGFHYHSGYAVEVDDIKARKLAFKAAKGGSAKGQALIAILDYDNASKQNLENIIRMAEDAVEEDEGAAMGLLAYIYAFEEGEKDNVLAEKWARKAAAKTDVLGQYVLGWLYMNGIVVEKNNAMAWAYLNLADKRLEDPKIDGKTLLEKVESRMTAKEKKRAKALQEGWFVDWGLQSFAE